MGPWYAQCFHEGGGTSGGGSGADAVRTAVAAQWLFLLLRLWCCRSMVSVSAPIRMRCRPTRAVADAVGVRIW